jgi:hypothetical protein
VQAIYIEEEEEEEEEGESEEEEGEKILLSNIRVCFIGQSIGIT